MKEELINKIEKRVTFLCEKCSIKELEKLLDAIEKEIGKIEKLERFLKKLGNE
jgi:superfamily II helicase